MNTFKPVTIISTDEALLQNEACDQLIVNAKQQGFEEREIVDVVDKFNWNDVLANSSCLSLFSQAKLTDIRFSKAPAKDAQNALVELLKAADQENCFLVIVS